MSRGVLYWAQGDTYLADAIRSATSSLRHNPLPHLILCDSLPASHPSGVDFQQLPAERNPYLSKISAMMQSPFEETLYLDTDTYVGASIQDLFALLSRFDLAVAHAPGYRGLADPEVPAAFFELNTGVLVYRRSPKIVEFFQSWQSTYRTWLASPPPFKSHQGRGAGDRAGIADQPAFRRCLWKSALSFYVLGPEYNYRPHVPGYAADAVKIIHGRAQRPQQLLALLNLQMRARSFNALIGPGDPLTS